MQKPATACRPLSVTAKPPAQRASWLAVAQRFIQRAKAGGCGVLQLTWPASTTTFNPLRILRVGDVAQLMRGANHSSPAPLDVARSPCPVARVPFLSSCARVRKRDEIMSVRIRPQALHESRSGPVAGHCPLLCVTGPPAKVRTSTLCTQSLALHDSRHTARNVSA